MYEIGFESCSDYKLINSTHSGDGLESTKNLNSGSVLFVEKPAHCQQTLTNKRDVLICGNCFTFLGNTEIQLGMLQRTTSRQDLGMNKPEIQQNIHIHSCKYQCGELYCSESCQNQHWFHSHELLCTGTVTEEECNEHPLIQFKTHAVQTNEIFLLVADIFSHILQLYNISGIPIEQSKVFFQQYVSQPWWDVVTVPDNKNPIEFKNTLKSLVKESYGLLSKSLRLKERNLNKQLTSDFMSR
jgi:hypothetical protein